MPDNPKNPGNSQLKKASALIRSQRNLEAANLLATYLKDNPYSEEGWMLLSYVVQNRHQKQECLLKAQAINPDNPRIEERLSKLQDGTTEKAGQKSLPIPYPERLPSQLRKRWLAGSVMVLSLGIIAVILYFGIQRHYPGNPTRKTQAAAVQFELLAQQTSQPTPNTPETPVHLSTLTPSSTQLPTISPNTMPPPPTYSYDSPSGEIGQQMDNIQNQVSTIRGLGILADNHRYKLPAAEENGLLNDFVSSRYTEDEIKDVTRVLSALGLIEPSYDVKEKITNDLGKGFGGFYIPWTNELFLTGSGFSDREKLVYVHEYNHALTDQHYHLENVGVYPECIYDSDRCLAISALVEGDATFLMYHWLDAYANEAEISEAENIDFSPIDKVITSTEFPPPYMIREAYFKYFDGQIFVEAIYEKGGWSAVNKAYQNLPITTEQILHPEKFLKGESPYELESIPLDNILGDDWRHIKTDTLGELNTQMVLGYNANYLVQIDPIEAADAAAGWGGDQYQVYYRGKTDQALLVAQWRWDSQTDGAEFWDALTTYMNRRYMGRMADDTDESCWVMINDHYSCIFRTSRNTLWLMAPGMEIIQLILDQYPEFQH